MKVVVKYAGLLLPIRKVEVSNFYQVTGYLNRHFRCCKQSLRVPR